MTGSNILRIFRHGVKLFGGEFLLSKWNAAKEKKINQQIGFDSSPFISYINQFPVDYTSYKSIHVCALCVGSTTSFPGRNLIN